MAIEPLNVDPSIHRDAGRLCADWATLFAASTIRAQRLQAHALICWQSAMLEIGT